MTAAPRPSDPRPDSSPPATCVLVGPGRRRNGLGPFLARELERCGVRVAAAVGRDPDRTRADAGALGEQLGHGVDAYTDLPEALAALRPHAVVIASPIASHLGALRAALAAGVPATLCEKPLVAPEEDAEVAALVDGFVRGGQLLMENCQLPFIAPVLWELYPSLHPSRRAAPPDRIELHMAPSGVGRAMVVDSASHFVSMLQALLPIDASTRVTVTAVEGRDERSDAARLDVTLESPFPTVSATLYLAVCAEQPRPQWFAVDGLRAERRIRIDDYTMSYWSGDRGIDVADPLGALVGAFARGMRERDVDRIREQAEAIGQRARIYRELVEAWDG